MKISLLPLFIMVIILSSCGNKNRQTDPATTINLDNLEEEAPALVDKLVEIEGTVIHVCRESGKRFFLGESQFKVLASSNIGRFNVGLEGSDVKVTGYLREERITEQYLNSWEEELQSDALIPVKEAVHTYEGELTGEPESATSTQLKQIQTYRERIAESGKNYLSFYSMEIVSLSEIK
ncbi:MAG: hypothetical protein M0P69_15835 [Bacteroidales bacterium]|jgi:hypothetical protein|nr:hypothetical protein [Bacteroidales bacterium]MDD2570693.1 hypothetical protein [Bacteroidales bacterium]MDD2813182.1 hypothetical protein [Bacteroidales bacterium]MDD3384914.1 hypothetical protein [Bacteroidales bacterium]MDD3811175.1 hypothetical protein [Bacteroidales bacterium]